MAVKRFVSTGYIPNGVVYFAPPGSNPGSGTPDPYYIIRLDENGKPYYTLLTG